MSAPETNERPKKILVVDDDPVTVKALSLKLKSIGYSVVTASEGSQALSATRQEKPDVMLLDIHFPPDVAHGGGVPWTGFLIAQWMHRLAELKDTPVILISASDRAEYKQRASAVGATTFLTKPIDNEALVSSIATALCRKSGGDAVKRTETEGQKPEPESPDAEGDLQPTSATALCTNERSQPSAVELGL